MNEQLREKVDLALRRLHMGQIGTLKAREEILTAIEEGIEKCHVCALPRMDCSKCGGKGWVMK